MIVAYFNSFLRRLRPMYYSRRVLWQIFGRFVGGFFSSQVPKPDRIINRGSDLFPIWRECYSRNLARMTLERLARRPCGRITEPGRSIAQCGRDRVPVWRHVPKPDRTINSGRDLSPVRREYDTPKPTGTNVRNLEHSTHHPRGQVPVPDRSVVRSGCDLFPICRGCHAHIHARLAVERLARRSRGRVP
jgi:hypothetical protein